MKTVTEKRYGEYYEDDKSVTLRSCSASVGGGSEVLVISYTPTELEHCAMTITKAQTDNTLNREN